MYKYIVIGGGIVGLATARAIRRREPDATILVLEKENGWAQHQTGRNSGVIHSGIYYKPGSLKATMARRGNQSTVEFCRQHQIQHDICGKLIVAADEDELPRLRSLYERGLQNGLSVTMLSSEQAKEIEPHVRCVAAVQVPSTGIVNYRSVCDAIAQELKDTGADLRVSAEVTGLKNENRSVLVFASTGQFEAESVINCAGLQSDRVVRMSGATPPAKIVPFRGEYYELTPQRRFLVKNLIYPVPNPDFPFLGVHFTRMIDGSVHAGPNAVFSFKREGYSKTAFSARDSFDAITFKGFWRMVARNAGEGLSEMWRSFSKAAFTRSLQRLVPEVTADDLIPSSAGVRAQALLPSGALVDDFLITRTGRILHVCNAPSPAATAALEIGEYVADALAGKSDQSMPQAALTK